MFQNLSSNLNKIFDKLKGKGFLNEEDVNQAMREIRIALLEADVALPVVKDLVAKIKERAIGAEVVKSISPGNMVVKIVNDVITEILSDDRSEINLAANPPIVMMMVGLQGSGKTTSTAKLAVRLRDKHRKKVLMASLDIYRPAAQEQLSILGGQSHIDVVAIIPTEKPRQIAERALTQAKLGGYDVLLLDSAGRLHIDQELMQELKDVKKISSPTEVILVVDSLTGQDAVNIAREFNQQIGVTGSILTRIDGDGRGGAALSIKQVAGCSIKFLGIGERIQDLEEFHADRIASRILGMGDIVSLVEKAAEIVETQEAEKMAAKLKKGNFDLNDLLSQMRNIKKIGSIGDILGMIPGLGKLGSMIPDDASSSKIMSRQEAIILSMTKKERKNPSIINASRKRRIASGSGLQVQDVNRLLKQFQEMQNMMKKVGKMDKKALMRSGLGNLMKKNNS